ncbi:MAG: 3-isopropylmalate dehydratase large subunit [Betaproteobacteria bacterium]|jgi:3-isopropylmalate/(R)-2-methylmalate dehydratase large subunit|nr:3-isopropylmalate dehydratase large subunit [Betaproteobacteria bacterium]
MNKTLFDKIWAAHWVGERQDGRQLIYIDRHIVHELHAPHAFADLDKSERTVRRKDITVVVQDHTVPTRMGVPLRSAHIDATGVATAKHGVKRLSVEDPRHGISHVISPEQGWAVPGGTLACPDSHSSTVGALGCLAFGCGTTEMVHVLSTQTIALDKPQQMRICLEGKLGFGVTAKDVALHLIRQVGVDFGRGHAVEYAGGVVRDMDLESRMTLCNMTIEWGGRTCLIAPDERTFAWMAQQAHSPKGDQWDQAVGQWRGLHTDADAFFDTQLTIDCSDIGPQITWGTDPGQTINVDESIAPEEQIHVDHLDRFQRALTYMDLQAGQSLLGVPIHRVFIGSCTNARITDLRHAAGVIQGRKVAPGVKALVVPGSNAVKLQAEREGLDQVFLAAGFEWHQSGCSMCAGANGEVGISGERCVATSNRNFENRQGRGVRTHLASPAMAAAAAIAGHIVDVRAWLPVEGRS